MRKSIAFIIFILLFAILSATQVQNEIQKLLASDGAADDHFGMAVDVYGDYAVVSARDDDDRGNESGSVYIYHLENGTWMQQQKLLASDGCTGDFFGESVSIHANTLIIGAYRNDDRGDNSGSAYIFELENGSWVEKVKLVPLDGAMWDYFGSSVSVYQDYAIVGAYCDDDNAGNSGSAYIYHKMNGSWTLYQKLTASDGAIGDCFGNSVAISDQYAVIGSDNQSLCQHSGAAYIFKLENGIWNQKQKIHASDADVDDYFGRAVAISDNNIAISSRYDDDNGSNSGSVYIFSFNGTAWVETQKVTGSVSTEYDSFGRSLSLRNSTLVVGAYGNDYFGENAGIAYVYCLENSLWEEKSILSSSDIGVGDYFGCLVGISDKYVIACSALDDDNGNNSGSAYIFEIEYYVQEPDTQQIVISLNDTTEHMFHDVATRLQFNSNHVETIMEITKYFEEPSVNGALPAGSENIAQNYWKVISSSGNVGSYDITFDLTGVAGIENFNTLGFLKRDDALSVWQDVVADLGATLVYNYPYITIQGLSSFSEFVPAGGDDNSLPVTLSSFNAVHTSGCRVQLTWSTASETEMNGFNVFRNSRNEEINAELVNSSIIRSNNVASGSEYNFCDIDVDHSSTYYYWLESVSLNGSSNIYGPVCVTISEEKDKETPQEFTNLGIKGIYPNPFNPETNIDYSVKEDTPVVISVFNLKGQKVKSLVDKTVSAGDHKIIWQGDSDSGSSVSSGVYFVKMITGNHIETRKIVLMK